MDCKNTLETAIDARIEACLENNSAWSDHYVESRGYISAPVKTVESVRTDNFPGKFSGENPYAAC
jgi:hypothetical protein